MRHVHCPAWPCLVRLRGGLVFATLFQGASEGQPGVMLAAEGQEECE
jgi:hypothetical protein